MDQKDDISAKRLAILIVTYNGERWIRKCLSSTAGADVLVLDNGSSDNTRQIIEEEFPQIELVLSNSNDGFGTANNKLLQIAYHRGNDFYFLLNQDAYLLENCIDDLIEIALKKKEFGVISPIHYASSEVGRLDANFLHFVHHFSGQELIDDMLGLGQLQEIYETQFTNAAGWLITRECLNNVGGFDPAFLHYGEDNDYCNRVLYHGFKIGIVPKAKMIHDRADRNKISTNLQLQPIQRRNVLVKYTNPVNNLEVVWRQDRRLITKQLIKSLLKLRTMQARSLLNELAELRQLKKIAVKSRELTMKPGLTFLSELWKV